MNQTKQIQKLLIRTTKEVDLDDFDQELGKFGIRLNTNDQVINYLKNKKKDKTKLYVLLENSKGGRSFIRSQLDLIKQYEGKFDTNIDSWYLSFEVQQ